jgi:hypothetical protein
MFCPNCGFNAGESNFCSNCGASLIKTGNLDDPESEFESEDSPLARFVGINSEFYLRKWRSHQEATVNGGWNWAAFLFGGIWLGYRKMYKIMAIYFLIWIAVILFSLFIKSSISEMLLGLVLAFCFGLKGNSWYYAFSKMKISEYRISKNGLKLEEYGGTSGFGLLGGLFLTVVVIIIFI